MSPMQRYYQELKRLRDGNIKVPRGLRPPFKPLKIGARQDVPPELERLLDLMVNTGQYRASLTVPSAMRHDLSGRPVEPVSREHARSARKNLLAASKRSAKKPERKKAPSAPANPVVVIKKRRKINR